MTTSPSTSAARLGPPTKHQLALMIWIAVFPALTALNFLLGDLLRDLPMPVRTLALATIAVPIVIYGLMPQLHRARAAIATRRVGLEARSGSTR